jgi:hypothetical protein
LSIIRGSGEDLGYRRLGPSVSGKGEELEIARSISTVIERMARFERMEDGGDVWIRERARRKGQTISRCMEVVLACSSTDVPDLGFVNNLARSGYWDAHVDIPMDAAQRLPR